MFHQYRPLRDKGLPTLPSSDEYIPLTGFREIESIAPLSETTQPKWRNGYNFGLRCCALTAGTVLFLNTLMAIVSRTKNQTSDSLAIFSSGDCKVARRLDIALHLLINLLSTLLLGASNYAMQCVSSPTRDDIDKAHRRNLWMDVGKPSLRNIGLISWPRRLLWGLFILSSVPLHFVYNSVVFSTQSVSEFSYFVVTDGLVAEAEDDLAKVQGEHPDLGKIKPISEMTMLDNSACIGAYSPKLVSAWGDALIVLDKNFDGSPDDSLWQTIRVSDLSTSESICDITLNCSTPATWTYQRLNLKLNATISHCLATKVPEHCELLFSINAMIAVIFCNVAKLVCLSLMLWKMNGPYLVTIGDAVASFLDSPDATTGGRCLVAETHYRKGLGWKPFPMEYHSSKPRWFNSASRRRWFATIAICVFTMAGAQALLNMAFESLGGHSEPSPFSLGFGAVNASATIQTQLKGLFAVIVISNTPQLLLSVLYLAYNNLWTCMLLVEEWAGYSTDRKPLRVTTPKSAQRSTYRLQLPYRYCIPLMIGSAFLHWLISQSLFLVVINVYDEDGVVDQDYSVLSCGYSPIAILMTLIAAGIILFIPLGVGWKRYKIDGIPLARGCSAAISAACHPPKGDTQASGKAVMWGACGNDDDGEREKVINIKEHAFLKAKKRLKGHHGPQVMVGHCSFTSLAVEDLVPGEVYM